MVGTINNAITWFKKIVKQVKKELFLVIEREKFTSD